MSRVVSNITTVPTGLNPLTHLADQKIIVMLSVDPANVQAAVKAQVTGILTVVYGFGIVNDKPIMKNESRVVSKALVEVVADQSGRVLFTVGN